MRNQKREELELEQFGSQDHDEIISTSPLSKKPITQNSNKDKLVLLNDLNCDMQQTITFVIPMTGQNFFCCGPSSKYSTKYPKELIPYIPENDFQCFLKDVNDKLKSHWPPQIAFCLAYVCFIFTAGFSCMIPMNCLKDTGKYLQWVIDEYNIKWEQKNVKIKWQRRLTKTWLEFVIQKNISEHIDFVQHQNINSSAITPTKKKEQTSL